METGACAAEAVGLAGEISWLEKKVKVDGMSTSSFKDRNAAFAADHVLFWTNLSRLNGVLVILNISMFFLTGLVTRGYYYTFYSLACLSVVALGMVIPTVLVRTILYYWSFLIFEAVGIYFFVASIVYWLRHGS
jgi:hypothetical protein